MEEYENLKEAHLFGPRWGLEASHKPGARRNSLAEARKDGCELRLVMA